MGYPCESGLGERYIQEDEDDGEEERGPVSGFAGTPMITDFREFCRSELKADGRCNTASSCDEVLQRQSNGK